MGYQPDFIVPEIEAIRTERFPIMKNKAYMWCHCSNYDENRPSPIDLEFELRPIVMLQMQSVCDLGGMPCVVNS